MTDKQTLLWMLIRKANDYLASGDHSAYSAIQLRIQQLEMGE